jgi:hypothetical protein
MLLAPSRHAWKISNFEGFVYPKKGIGPESEIIKVVFWVRGKFALDTIGMASDYFCLGS